MVRPQRKGLIGEGGIAAGRGGLLVEVNLQGFRLEVRRGRRGGGGGQRLEQDQPQKEEAPAKTGHRARTR